MYTSTLSEKWEPATRDFFLHMPTEYTHFIEYLLYVQGTTIVATNCGNLEWCLLRLISYCPGAPTFRNYVVTNLWY